MWMAMSLCGTPRISDVICTSDAAWPPPMSGTPVRTRTVPSIWSSTHALAQSWSQTIRRTT
jgi:hypothetical protein